mmetsp:Transcript_2274/g.3133  ORF Transcript_2274/g.3133 Transcript_2274/m.3133 type:complete len:344 (+) Transcript_2274:112-1143(+)
MKNFQSLLIILILLSGSWGTIVDASCGENGSPTPAHEQILLTDNGGGDYSLLTHLSYRHTNLKQQSAKAASFHSFRGFSFQLKRRALSVRGGARNGKGQDPTTTTATKIPTPTRVVFLQSFFSVALTAAGLLGILYAGHHPVSARVTNFISRLGLPEKLFGLPLTSYASFWVLTFAASLVTKIAAGGVTVSTRQTLLPTETPSAEWYSSLEKPTWNPPGWLFPIMWLIFSKPTQFLALRQLFLSSITSKKEPNWSALSIYCTHLALGNTWNDVFFGFQRIGLGMFVISLFWLSLLTTAILFYKETEGAGLLMLPTLGWVTVATALNWSIYELNKGNASGIKKQ